MSTIDKHVDVQISKETATVSRTGFGTPCVLTYHTRFPQAYRLYGSTDEMTTDGFATTDLAYKMVAAIFAQSPRPTSVVVGRRLTAPTRDVKLTPKTPLLASTAYPVTINGETFTFTTDATPTVSEVTAGLVALIDAGGEDVNATDNTTDLDIESAAAPGGAPAAGVPFTVTFDPSQFTFNDQTVDAGWAAELTALKAATEDWYGLAVDEWGALGITALAAAIASSSTPKIYIADSQDSDIIEAGSADIASTLAATNNDRVGLMYHPDSDPSTAASLLGRMLPLTPGAATWKFKTLTGVTAAALDTGEIAQADAKNCNTYTEVGGISITAEGVMTSSEFTDVTRFIDWLTARTKENVFRALAINDKVPYTNAGIQSIVGEIEGVLRQGVLNGGINPDEDITVTAPLASEVDANDRAGRLLPDINFLATLAGAIHKTVIRGKVVA